MRIGLDISLLPGNMGGGSTYTAGLLDGLAAIDGENDYYLYPFFYYIFHPDLKSLAVPEKRNFHIRFRSLPYSAIEYLWFRSGFPRKKLLGKVDVLHSTTFCVPEDYWGKLVVTIYDVSFLLFPSCHIEANRLHCLEGTLKAACRADKIIAISESSKRDLMEYLAVTEKKIAVTPLAARSFFRPAASTEQAREELRRHKLDRPYILTVGSLEPRKNTVRLLEAFALMSPRFKKEYELVVVGRELWEKTELPKIARKMGLADRVRLLGYVSERELVSLYNLAELFCYPSLYEGFGLPVLEAMACGTPVVASNRSSIPEVAGSAAVLVNPEDPLEIACAMEVLLEKAQFREQLSQAGLEQARKFSWEKTAEQTLRVYHELAD